MVKTTHLIAVFSLALWFTGGCSGHKQESDFGTRNTLSPCPDSPNCVSTKGEHNAMSPLPYAGSTKESQDLLIKILGSMARCTIVNADPGYIHAEFRSALFGFVDDVNFVLDDDARLIDFRSASRTGYYDFGVNRKRMEEISRLYLEDLKRT